MTRLTLTLAIALVIAVVAACEPSGPPEFARRSSPPATAQPSAGTSASASGAPSGSAGPEVSASAGAPTGSPRIEIAGDTVTVTGSGDKLTDIFPLDGTYDFVLTACTGTGVIPFIYIFEEFGQGRGQYVDAEFTVKNLVGNFYLRVSGPPTCEWTVTLTKA